MIEEIAYTINYFLFTYEWAKEARVLHYTDLEGPARNKHSSLLVPFVNYEENKAF
jgi:hypothetical protein